MMRLDARLVSDGFARSRDSAKRAIKEGHVKVDGVVVKRASTNCSDQAVIEYSGVEDKYVSRGALKLIAGLEAFGFDPAGATCLDLGASTGGFTEVLLQRGASKVFAVDVGRGQLHSSLKSDIRVLDVSPIHAKDLTTDDVGEVIDFFVCDVSFISLLKALPVPLSFCRADTRAVILVKPQFELGPDHIGKGGLVTMPDIEVQSWIDATVISWLTEQNWQVQPLIDSPIKGGDGNKEYLLGAVKI